MSTEPSRTRLTRRRVIHTGVWGAPTLAVAAAAPAIAASQPTRVTAQFGVFAQVADTQRDDEWETEYGTQSFGVEVPSPTGTAPGTTGLVTAGSGTFTPGGSLGKGVDGQYGGAGLWISTPVDSAGKFVAGTSTLLAGATIVMSYTATFPAGTGGYEPAPWFGGANNFVALPGGTSLRESFNGAPFTAAYSTGQVDGDTWTGTVTITTTADLVASDMNVPYNQILTSQAMAYYTEHGPETFTATLTVISGTVNVNAPALGLTATINLAGQTTTATL